MSDKEESARLLATIQANSDTALMVDVVRYLKFEYEGVKELLVDDDNDVLRGEAQRLRKLIKKFSEQKPVTIADTLTYMS